MKISEMQYVASFSTRFGSSSL